MTEQADVGLVEVKVDTAKHSNDDGDDVEPTEHKSGQEEHKDKPSAAPPAAPAEPEFEFVKLLRETHRPLLSMKGFGNFLFKYTFLQLLRTVGNFSFLIVTVILPDLDITNIDPSTYSAFIIVGVLNIVARLVPPVATMMVDEIKAGLQAEQGTQVVRKIFELEHSSVVSTPTGEFAQLISKVFMNIDKFLPALYGFVIPTIAESLVGVVLIGVLFGPIAIVQVVLLLAFSFAAYVSAKKKAQRNKEMMMVMFSQWGKLLASASSYERAHYFDRVEHEVEKSRDSFTFLTKMLLGVTRGDHVSAIVLQMICLPITAIWVFAIPSMAPTATPLQIVALAFYIFTFVGDLSGYANAIAELRSALFEATALTAFINRLSGVRDVEDAVEIESKSNPEIEFKNVSFSYGGRQILQDVSFKVKGGTTLGIVGSSGCGKSTIMRLLLRFYRQSEGTITIDGHDITKVTGASLRRLFSVVTQDSQLYNASIRDNIEYGLAGASDEAITRAAALAELQFDADLTLDKDCGEKGAKLSGGQQQRVSLARAMLKNGTIYLLDEPTTGLDGVVAKQLQATLDKLATNATSITITHHLEDLRKTEQILYLDKGKIVESGSFEELCKLQGHFYEQLQARAS